MDNIEIRYTFQLNEKSEIFDIILDGRKLELIRDDEEAKPEWTELGCHQCSHCPLDKETTSHCPVALNIASVIKRLGNICSHDQIALEVQTKERTIIANTSAQRGISSMIGLLIATSGCPHTEYMKPMARFHLPLSSEEDTIFRATGMYLLAQYFLRKAGMQEDMSLNGLTDIYKNLHLLNKSIAERIRFSAPSDASVNALILLDMFTNLMPFVIEDHLDEIRYLFDAYLA